VAGCNGGCGLPETHPGHSQLVSDSSTVALSPLVVCCDWLFVMCVFGCYCVCVRRCCVVIVGVAELWMVFLLVFDLCGIFSFFVLVCGM